MLLEEEVRGVLVLRTLDHLAGGEEDDRSVELGAVLREQNVIEVGQGDNEADVVRAHELAQRRQVAGVDDAGDDRVHVGVVERGRERVRVDRDRRRAGAAERRDDVDALAGAGEENGRHAGSLEQLPSPAASPRSFPCTCR